MGFFGRVFQGQGGNAGRPWRKRVHGKNRANAKRGGFAGGYGSINFANVINAHSSAEEIVEEFALDTEDAIDGNCYQRAYRECRAEAMIEMMIAGDLTGDVEDYIDYDEVESRAYDYAVEMAEKYISGARWIPSEIMDWAWYDVSDHNG